MERVWARMTWRFRFILFVGIKKCDKCAKKGEIKFKPFPGRQGKAQNGDNEFRATKGCDPNQPTGLEALDGDCESAAGGRDKNTVEK